MLRTVWRKLRALGQRRVVKREIDEELRFHLEQRTAENIAAGMAPEEAAREEWKRRSTSFQNLEAWTGGTYYVGTADRPEQFRAAAMTPGFFRMTGSPMLMGRVFLPEEGEPGKDHVVIMTHRVWIQYFGADKD